MTSMASRYFQGLVIETNEPCYISCDTESCCSKIQSLIELKLEAPNLSTDHRCHWASEEEHRKSTCFTTLLSLFTLRICILFYVHSRTSLLDLRHNSRMHSNANISNVKWGWEKFVLSSDYYQDEQLNTSWYWSQAISQSPNSPIHAHIHTMKEDIIAQGFSVQKKNNNNKTTGH